MLFLEKVNVKMTFLEKYICLFIYYIFFTQIWFGKYN